METEKIPVEQAVKEYYKKLNTIVQKRDMDGKFHPSSFGYCVRKLWFHHTCHEPQHQIPHKLRSCFEHGHAIHDFLQARLIKAFEDDPNTTVSIEVPVGDTDFAKKFEIAGSADGLIETSSGTRMIYEAKSISKKGWTGLGSPKAQHVMQASIYAKCLDAHSILFEYFCKDNDESKFFHVAVDEKAVNSATMQIDKVRTAVNRLEIVPAEGSSYECNTCQYAYTCTKDEQLKDYHSKVYK